VPPTDDLNEIPEEPSNEDALKSMSGKKTRISIE